MFPTDKEFIKDLEELVKQMSDEGHGSDTIIEVFINAYGINKLFAKTFVKEKLKHNKEVKQEKPSEEIKSIDAIDKGFELEEILHKEINSLTKFKSHYRGQHKNRKQSTKLIEEKYGNEITAVDHLFELDDYIITIQDKWEESNPKMKEIKAFISDSEKLAIKTQKKLAFAIYASKKPTKGIAEKSLTDANDKYPHNVFVSFFNNSQTGLVEEVSLFLKNELERLGLIESLIDSSIPKWGLRDNQQKAVDNFKKECLNKDGLITGIHAQATGAGKTLIGVSTINEHFKWSKSKKKSPHVIWITERNDVLDLQFGKNEAWKIWENSGFIGSKNKDFTFIEWNYGKEDIEGLHQLLEKSKKPVFLITTRASLTNDEKYKKINPDIFSGIIYDECHGAGSSTASIFLKYAMKEWTHLKWIQGFSATPIRRERKKFYEILKLFGEEITTESGIKRLKLNLLSTYNMIEAISDGKIVPPTFYWIEVKTDKAVGVKDVDEKLKADETKIYLSKLEELLNKSVTKKAIAWCETTKSADEWYKFFNKIKDEDLYNCPILKQMTFYINHTDRTVQEQKEHYINFQDSEEYSFMISVGRFREGSDIKNLDTGIFLDHVNKRGEIPFIQSLGRTLRHSEDGWDKETGLIMDSFSIENKDDRIKKITALVLGYYLDMKGYNLDGTEYNDNDDEKTKEEKVNEEFKDILDKLDCKTPGQIKLKVKDKYIVFNITGIELEHFEWSKIPEEMRQQLKQELYGQVSYTDAKIIVQEAGIKTKEEYNDLAFKDDRLPKKPEQDYGLSWKGWIDFLGLKRESYYQTKTEIIEAINSLGISTAEDYREQYSKDPKLPPITIFPELLGDVYTNFPAFIGTEEFFDS